MQYLPKADVAKMLRVMHKENKLHHLAALIGFFCGARISQVLNVRGEDIFQHGDKWVIKIRAAKRGDAGLYSLHIDSDEAFDMTALIALAKTKGQSRIFGGLSRQFYNLRLKHYGELAGIHSDFLHSHIWRHSGAMIVFDATQRIGAVSKFLLHKSASSAFIYLAENDGHLAQEAMDSLQLV